MSDKETPSYEPHDLQAALSHIASTTANVACPFCGCKTWTLETEGSEGLKPYLAYVQFSASHMFGPAPVIPAIVLSCDECGFIRQHNLPHILAKFKGAR